MEQNQTSRIASASELFTKLFTEILTDSNGFDHNVVALTKEHLGSDSPLTKAGSNLAVALLELAKQQVEEK